MPSQSDVTPVEARPLTLVIGGVEDLTDDLVDAVYEAAGGQCEVGLASRLLYVELPADAKADIECDALQPGWRLIPNVLLAVRGVVTEAALLRVEAADSVTAAQRSKQPLAAVAG